MVVDTEKTGKDCIQHLPDTRSGQATFIPLDTIQVKALNSSLKGLHQNMRPAIETVDFDQSVSRTVSSAGGNSIVRDDLDTAKYLGCERGVDAKAVSLDGTVIHKGGLMAGGRGPGHQSSRWEDAEVGNLNKLTDKLMKEPCLHRIVVAMRRNYCQENFRASNRATDLREKSFKGWNEIFRARRKRSTMLGVSRKRHNPSTVESRKHLMILMNAYQSIRRLSAD